MSADLLTAVKDAAARPEVLAAVGRVYEDIARSVAARRPVCEMSGRCCQFEAYGHRLYVSTLELAAFLAGIRDEGGRLKDEEGNLSAFILPPSSVSSGCPFQRGKLCSVHLIRPFGCRMYFCDPTAQDWQQGEYERFHGRLKALHEQFGVDYYYVEWRQALRELGLAAAP